MNTTLEFLRELAAIKKSKDEDFARVRAENNLALDSLYQRYKTVLNLLAEKYGVPVELIE
jgi:hypothetical protein